MFIMENPIKMDDLGVPLFSETPKSPLNNHGYFSMHLEEHLFASTEAVAIAAKPQGQFPLGGDRKIPDPKRIPTNS